jgi:hypothetical protein
MENHIPTEFLETLRLAEQFLKLDVSEQSEASCPDEPFVEDSHTQSANLLKALISSQGASVGCPPAGDSKKDKDILTREVTIGMTERILKDFPPELHAKILDTLYNSM